jgi:EmrB/QacA subfamily drug resistance transporter
VALGAWGAVSGLAIALGPLVGGAVVQGLSWHWIFWLNVPIGLVALPLAAARLTETTGPDRALDLPGLALASAGLFGVVFGLVRGNDQGWGSLGVAGPLTVGGLLLVALLAWELRAAAPMIPMRFFHSRGFSAANATSLLLFFGMFGSIFLLTQFLQLIRGYSPLEAGIRTLPWTGMLVLVGPVAGALSDRIGSRSLVVAGMALVAAALAWLAAVATPAVPYAALVAPFVLAGAGMSLFFAPTANAVLSAVSRAEEGKASGVLNTIRQVGGVLGVAVLATVFSAAGGYMSPGAFVDGLAWALWAGAAMVGLGAIAALGISGRQAALPRQVAGQATGGRRMPRPATTWEKAS